MLSSWTASLRISGFIVLVTVISAVGMSTIPSDEVIGFGMVTIGKEDPAVMTRESVSSNPNEDCGEEEIDSRSTKQATSVVKPLGTLGAFQQLQGSNAKAPRPRGKGTPSRKASGSSPNMVQNNMRNRQCHHWAGQLHHWKDYEPPLIACGSLGGSAFPPIGFGTCDVHDPFDMPHGYVMTNLGPRPHLYDRPEAYQVAGLIAGGVLIIYNDKHASIWNSSQSRKPKGEGFFPQGVMGRISEHIRFRNDYLPKDSPGNTSTMKMVPNRSKEILFMNASRNMAFQSRATFRNNGSGANEMRETYYNS
ncbi:unnamed protein product [Cyprideis torosa]|uniref:Uncharacterized protein n=1 Tax=Cyprideis torosa TaxID=163714 RepID=A0A7R8ZGL4_9CRUS|nr:unnamed protein product [Cyprideis torosa]CAG0881930.1 unnamed protein product [Cyprideis torosa]